MFSHPLPTRQPQSGEASSRELEVITLIVLGYTNPEIAARLGIAEQTVKTHVRRVLAKFSARNRAHLALRAQLDGVVVLACHACTSQPSPPQQGPDDTTATFHERDDGMSAVLISRSPTASAGAHATSLAGRTTTDR